MAPPLTITIRSFSDTVCPWSFIGKKNLDKAIDTYKEQHPDVAFVVAWNPFYLHPEAKISGEAPNLLFHFIKLTSTIPTAKESPGVMTPQLSSPF